MTATKKKELEESVKLRFDFIGMMFALAIGQVGLEIGKFYIANNSIFDYPYIFSHLGLVIFIIASSWIGWKNSKSKGSTQSVEDPFGFSFIILLLDLFLVLCYFVLVSKVDRAHFPDGKPEVFWSLSIFAAYFIWDFLSKFITTENPETLKLKIDLIGFLKRGYQSFVCFLIVFLFVRPMNINASSTRVIIIDFALLCTFILFRGLKTKDLFYLKNNRSILILITGVILPVSCIILSYCLNFFYYV